MGICFSIYFGALYQNYELCLETTNYAWHKIEVEFSLE